MNHDHVVTDNATVMFPFSVCFLPRRRLIRQEFASLVNLAYVSRYVLRYRSICDHYEFAFLTIRYSDTIRIHT